MNLCAAESGLTYKRVKVSFIIYVNYSHPYQQSRVQNRYGLCVSLTCKLKILWILFQIMLNFPSLKVLMLNENKNQKRTNRKKAHPSGV